jgi:DNA-binding transcriptional LysR family regulator
MIDLLALSNLEIRQVCYFLMVVECDNNFSRAAERLHIEQPPLSQRIQALEKRLKVTLFNRRKRPAQLTSAGLIFWEEATRSLEQMQRAINQAQQAAQGEIGHLTIGVASSAANGVLSDVLKRFRDRYPNVMIVFRELTAEQQIKELEAKQLDVGLEVISRSLLENRGFAWRIVDEESLVVALPEEHSLTTIATNKGSVTLTDLATESLILPNVQEFPFYNEFLEKCALAGFKPRLVEGTTATWMLTILSLVAAGVGLAILPSNVKNLQRKGVVYCDISGLNLTRQLVAAWRSDSTSITLHNWLALLP